MKVAVVGGTGVFGSRLAELLVKDDHDVVIIGRNATKLEACAQRIGATPLVLDRNGALDALWGMSPDVVIDAAGPFHAYGDDPYRLAKNCIAQGCHYIDLSDDADFAARITELDELAKQAGVFAVSGASSVPALSSAVVRHLSKRAREIDSISTAILPGNRAPRGYSVIDAVVSQAGTNFETVIDGKPTKMRSWSDSRMFDLGQGIKRRGFVFGVGDQKFFPQRFMARSVEFRAGLELGIMADGLALFSWLRGLFGFNVPRIVKKVFWRLAQLLYPFGTGVGGMSVEVTGSFADKMRRKTWRLVARDGQGLFVPGIAARTIVRHAGDIKAGARPALDDFTLAQATDAMADLAVTTEILDEVVTPLFPDVLGDFENLPAEVQETHLNYGPRHWTGTAKVSRGKGWYVALIASLFRLPKAQDAIDVSVLKTPFAKREVWQRQFGKSAFASELGVGVTGVTERFGPFSFDLAIHVKENALHFPVSGGRILGIPMPLWALPKSNAREYVKDGKFHFDVELLAPLTRGTVVHYRGWLERDNAEVRSVNSP